MAISFIKVLNVFYTQTPSLARACLIPVCNHAHLIYKSYSSTKQDEWKSGVKLPGSDKKKRSESVRITLISNDGSISIRTLEEATKLSQRRDLKLVKIVDFDVKTQRPVYRLMTGAEYHAADLQKRAEIKASNKEAKIKGEKILTMNGTISEHDLNARMRNLSKWLQKLYEVQVVICGNAASMDKAEKVYSSLESELSGKGRILQKRTKGTDIRCTVQPIFKKESGLNTPAPPDQQIRSVHSDSAL